MHSGVMCSFEIKFCILFIGSVDDRMVMVVCCFCARVFSPRCNTQVIVVHLLMQETFF